MAGKIESIPYWQKLKDPRWQRKRLEIMERDGFACCWCGDTETTLNVHHGYYEKGMEPWQYDNNTLWTLCESCHEEVEEDRRLIYRCLARDIGGCSVWLRTLVDLAKRGLRPRPLDFEQVVVAGSRVYHGRRNSIVEAIMQIPDHHRLTDGAGI